MTSGCFSAEKMLLLTGLKFLDERYETQTAIILTADSPQMPDLDGPAERTPMQLE